MRASWPTVTWASLCISSRVRMQLPCPSLASLISVAKASFMGTPLRACEKLTIQRNARAVCRLPLISSGIW